ncbi:MAG: DNA polymerase III subunits gamma/tau [Mycobacteriaceae bacterium]
MALYRKYRPATFADVIGQEHVTEPLSTALDAGRINHAYLFSGPRGCGKTSSARILARSLNCVQGPTSRPCGVCDSCVGLGPGGAGTFDVTELDAASHGGVDDTRELRDHAGFSPASARYRIFIIDEAHMVTTQGFNALLKIVEEPPEHVVFIFATTEPDKVLPTIRSRTHHYPFRLLAPAVMRGLLERICVQEQVTVEQAVYPLVIRAGGGSPRDSLSVLDQLLAGAGPEGVTYARALSLLGVTDVGLIDDAVDALAAQDGAELFGAVDRLVEAGHDPRRFAVDLLDRFRDLILLRAVPDAGERGLVDAPGDVLERMVSEAERIGAATLTRYAEVVHAGLTEMRGATAPRLLLEVVCARMLLPSASDAESAVLQRLERVERRMTITPPSEDQASAYQRPSRRAAQPESRSAGEVVEDGAARTAPENDDTEAPAAEDEATVAAPSTGRPAATVEEEPDPSTAVPSPSAADDQPDVGAPRTPSVPPSGPVDQQEGVEDVPPGRSGAPRRPLAGQPDAAAVRRVWSEVRNAVRTRSRTTEVMLSSATVRRIEGDTLVLSHDSAPLAKRITESRNADVVREALRDVLGVDWTVVCESVEAQPAPSTPAAASRVQRPAGGPRYTRPVRAGGADGGSGVPTGPEAVPLPDEPSDPDDPEPAGAAPEADDEEALLQEAAHPVDAGSVERRDPHEVALELLASELGARPLNAG